MSVREGFRRIEMLYWRRWWLIIVAPAVMFSYRILERPSPTGVDPGLWLAAKSVLLGVASTMTLAIVVWLILGFVADPAEWERRLDAAQQTDGASAKNDAEPPRA